jgi:hypothetical protein
MEAALEVNNRGYVGIAQSVEAVGAVGSGLSQGLNWKKKRNVEEKRSRAG